MNILGIVETKTAFFNVLGRRPVATDIKICCLNTKATTLCKAMGEKTDDRPNHERENGPQTKTGI